MASFPIVAVGASAGGLEAFTQLLGALPPDTGMGFVLIQHLDPEHESALVQLLSRATSLPVIEITNGQPVEANHVHVIPRDTKLSIVDGVLKLQPRERTRNPHRPIDAFFESLAEDRRELSVGVVLSGTANDGTLGLVAIKSQGGITFAQDDSAKHHSMPRSAVAAGCVDLVLSPALIAKELARIASHPYVAGQSLEPLIDAQDDAFTQGDSSAKNDRSLEDAAASATTHQDDQTPLPSGGHATTNPTPRSDAKRKGAEADRGQAQGPKAASGADEGYKKILLLLRNHSGVDFSLYKSATIQRRINRRVVISAKGTLTEYADFLRGNAKELDTLYSDVLISVTSFFRDPATFELLQRHVLPALLEQPGDDPIRCWVLGCSTGQEAYSIAISFVEAMGTAPRLRKLQVFATDLNEALLEKARYGLYAKSLAEDLAPERLRRFFVEEEGGYRVNKMLREMVVFARQNLISDPPFSRLDLISCRNLLIYLEPSLQKKALPTFHYALKPGGFLLLGASESIGGFTDLFDPVEKKHKIFSKKPAPTPTFHLPMRKEHGGRPLSDPRPPLPRAYSGGSEPAENVRGELNAQREADRITVSQFGPPAALVNAELQVVQFRGPTGAYLEPPAGKATFDVLKMARKGLMLPLRAAINEARKENKTARRENIRIERDGTTQTVNVRVVPLKNLPDRCFLILFEDAASGAVVAASPRKQRKSPLTKEEEAGRVADLETELAETRGFLQSVQEQHEAANEELQAANEEAQSANEELQSMNEELETSKEELESANEELNTVNEEMSSRNVELNRLNNDLVNIQTSTKLAIVVLGRDLTIRRFTPQAERQLGLQASDVGRPISHIRHGLVDVTPASEPAANGPPRTSVPQQPSVDLERLSADVVADVREQQREVLDKNSCWHLLRVRPYMTLDNKVDGAVLVFTDIDALKRSEQATAAARDLAEHTFQAVREPLLVLDKELRVETANRSFYRTFGVTPADTIGQVVYELGGRQWDIPRLREVLGEIVPRNTTIEGFQVERDFENIGKRVMLLNGRRILGPERDTPRILLAIEDITTRQRAEEELRESHGELRSHADELTRFNRVAVGRESRMIELKKEVNELRGRLGETVKYPLRFDDDDDEAPAPRLGEER